MAYPVILDAEPIVYDYRDGRQNCLGFSAEQLAAIDARLVNYDSEGRPESINTNAFLAHLLDALLWLRTRIEALETIKAENRRLKVRIAELEAAGTARPS